MQVLPVRYDEVREGDALMHEYFSFESAGTSPTTRLYVGGERVACRGFHVVTVVKVENHGDDVVVTYNKATGVTGEVTSSVGNQTLRVQL